MSKFTKWVSVIALCLSFSAIANGNVKGITCTYQTGYGEGSFFLGYDFDLETKNFQNLVTKSAGPIDMLGNLTYYFSEGEVAFDQEFRSAILNSKRVINGQTHYGLKCKQKPRSKVIVDSFNFDLLFEDKVDGELKSSLDFLNYCGNQNAVLSVDISKYVHQSSPWAKGKLSLFGKRDQFGQSFECFPGERRRENFKLINQLLNEARENNNKLAIVLTIRKEHFAPSGYAIKVELVSKKLNRSFFFFDNLNAAYSL